MATKRKAVSTKTRFDVFKRDRFVCQYCGSHPPTVVLHVDHIHPVAAGGTNDVDNLITSCSVCNLGKGARSLSAAPQSLEDKAAETKEREAQLAAYTEIMQGKRDREEDEAWRVVDMMIYKGSEVGIRKDWLMSVKRFVAKLGYTDALDAAEVAVSKGFTSDQRTFTYFCGVCWAKVREAEGTNA